MMNFRDLSMLRSMLILLGTMMVALPDIRNVMAQEEANVSFRWAFGALVSTGNPPKPVPITQDTTLQTGDQLKMLVELQKRCFVYVIHHGPQGEVHWLFPNGTQQLDNDYHTGKRYDIPPGDGWLRLDNQVGRETFYLLASAERLTDIEALLSRYAAAPQAEQPQLSAQIVTEIREVKKRYRQLVTPAERPVPIAGNMRGPDIADAAVEITANNFYSKTFTIEHR